jgi:putative tricarboxylic transport membrane protein
MLMMLNLPLIGIWVAILRIPYRVLYPAILVFISLGVYSVNNNTFDVLMVAIIGAVGYAMAVLRFEAAPMLLGFVLGPLMEENLRRALLLSRGDMMTFVERPISGTLLAFGGAMLLWTLWGALKRAARASERKADFPEAQS